MIAMVFVADPRRSYLASSVGQTSTLRDRTSQTRHGRQEHIALAIVHCELLTDSKNLGPTGFVGGT